MATFKEYEAPDYSGRQKTWDESQALKDAAIKNLEDQSHTIGAIPGQLEQSQNNALSDYSMNTGRVLASGKGMLGGGGGLSILRQAAKERGVGQGKIMNEYAGDISQAKVDAKAAEGQVIAEKQKLLEQAALRQAKVNSSLDKAKGILDEEAGKQYVTFDAEDRKRTANRIRQEVLATETDPMVIAAVEKFILDLQEGNTNVEGLIDT